ncbi:hypothetical protein EV363DRAFT_1335476 [Boletus edulis]|uniref:Uncharacterized protein n=1 Tax=Boletus edulis BED1 TaxID=1328754 RepID=A0AAD4G906_BOLED|nr:hypothetical protein EV363DRAFT_1335476 [Boletus edulis]KAF8430591.1 hypothetical protein L210DRAFT_3562100 [Boletus edulis BED1]
MLVFPKETHSIDGVEAARVSFEAGRDWFVIIRCLRLMMDRLYGMGAKAPGWTPTTGVSVHVV